MTSRLAFLVAAVALAASPAYADPAVEKTLKSLVTAVRYGKDDLAIKNLDGATQGELLLEAEWAKGTPEQRAKFTTLFHKLFAAIAFPNIRDNFKHLETTLYEKPAIEGDKGSIVSTIVILHPLKKQEIKVKYDMHKDKGGWKVVDVTVLGSGGASMLTDIRKDQVQPLFKQGGWDKLLTAMETRLAQIEKAAK